MRDPADLFRLETDCDPGDLHASVLLVALGGFLDAGNAGGLATQHVLQTREHRVVASFDVDELLDYRGRRPMMTFERDRWTSYDDPALLLHRVLDADGTPFLLLTGPEPDYQWERFVEAVQQLMRLLDVELTVTVHGIPMAVPHTRPLGVTAHATDTSLLGEHDAVFGSVQVPGSAAALLELRLGEAGRDALGYAVHVPHYLAQSDFADAAVVALESVSGATGLHLPIDELAATAGLNRAEIAAEVADSEEAAEVVEGLERQYDTFIEGKRRRSLLATGVSDLPTADEIGAQFEAFLQAHEEDEADRPDGAVDEGRDGDEAPGRGEDD
ncbi:MAG TPA: PAC2 family protein [Segeticoccus sp.]|nr:PAC2 family protein [Segeticoccus sp.]